MEEVAKGIAYTLINVPEINSIKLIDEWFENSCYTIKEVETILYEGYDLIIYNLQQDGVGTKILRKSMGRRNSNYNTSFFLQMESIQF